MNIITKRITSNVYKRKCSSNNCINTMNYCIVALGLSTFVGSCVGVYNIIDEHRHYDHFNNKEYYKNSDHIMDIFFSGVLGGAFCGFMVGLSSPVLIPVAIAYKVINSE